MTEIIKKETETQLTQKDYENYLISSGVLEKLTEAQKNLFFAVAAMNNLNPFKREIYVIPFKNKETGKYEISLLTGYEVYIRRANESGLLDGWSFDFVGEGGNRRCILTIYRKDWQNPFKFSTVLKEVNKNTAFWKLEPEFMHFKVTASRGFRLCFPDILGGMPYTQEEYQNDSRNDLKDVQEAEIIEKEKSPEKEQPLFLKEKALHRLANVMKKHEITKEFVSKAVKELFDKETPRDCSAEEIEQLIEGIVPTDDGRLI